MLREIDWGYIGALLANEGDNEQVKFFKAFVKECNSWGTHIQVEQQLAFVNSQLTTTERQTLSMLSYMDE